MAFHQQTRPALQRNYRPSTVEDEAAVQNQTTPNSIEESQTWVLFSPPTETGTTSSYLTGTHASNITPGRSRLSDLGSLRTLSRADTHEAFASLIDPHEIEEEDDGELDSLDSHLPEFRSTPDFFSSSQAHLASAPVVPAHDGLGSFRLDQELTGADMQDRLYAFEQFNPRRIRRRRESLEQAQLQGSLGAEQAAEIEKIRWIESWRLEQSRLLLDEVEKETRRRQQQQHQHSSGSAASTKSISKTRAEEIAAFDALGDQTDDVVDNGEDWHEQAHPEPADGQEGVWGRITRKVIRDILGIDDRMLSVLMGETLADEEDLSTTPRASSIAVSSGTTERPAGSLTQLDWQDRALERIAKELGLLVHQLSEHPGAFTTFSRVQHAPLPYAGLPSIPESVLAAQTAINTATDASVAMPEFKPTIGTQTRPIDVPTSRAAPQATPQTTVDNSGASFTQEEWEKDLDIRLVFRYLRSRFMSRPSSANGGSALNTASSQDIAAKAARVRQHHPLVSRARPADRRNFKAAGPASPVLFRPASSCASQSTRRSVRRGSGSSSRHYWDIGGSVGTRSSIVATSGPMGSWGEV